MCSGESKVSVFMRWNTFGLIRVVYMFIGGKSWTQKKDEDQEVNAAVQISKASVYDSHSQNSTS